MKRSKFFFKQNYLEAADLFSDTALRAEFILAVSRYGIDGSVYQGDSEVIRIAMALVMPQIDKENRRYEIAESDAAQSRVATCRDRDDTESDTSQSRFATCRDHAHIESDTAQSRVATCRDRQDRADSPAPDHRLFRQWIKINAPNVYQHLCRSISNRDLAAICARHELRQLRRKILMLEHNGKKMLQNDTLVIALRQLEGNSAAA